MDTIAPLLSVVDPLRTLWRFAPVCQDVASFNALRGLRDRNYPVGSAPVPVRLRALKGGQLFCRPHATDYSVLYDTYVRRLNLPPGDLGPIRTILDLGSNIGTTLAHYAVLFPQARIIGVELDAGNAEICRRNTAAYPNVTLLHGAVWTEDGSIAYGGGFGEFGFRINSTNTKGRVPAFSLGTLIERLGGSGDFIKMDIEGAEQAILGRPDPAWSRVGALKVEIHEPDTCAGATADLTALGFRVTEPPGRRDALVAYRN